MCLKLTDSAPLDKWQYIKVTKITLKKVHTYSSYIPLYGSMIHNTHGWSYDKRFKIQINTKSKQHAGSAPTDYGKTESQQAFRLNLHIFTDCVLITGKNILLQTVNRFFV